MKRIAVYITGGIAAYKVIFLVRQLQRAGYDLRVVMSDAACKFINPQTIAALLKKKVETQMFVDGRIPHIELADWTDAAVIVPATANIVGKMATGIADDLVSTALLATAAPKFLVPAMNSKMWDNPATQRNIARLKEDGVKVLAPAVGYLAEGYSGKGRMPEPEEIYSWLERQWKPAGILKGKKVVVSAGATYEPIDPVRFISNYSSGKMGIALAKEAQKLGADVVLVAGRVTEPLPAGVKVVQAEKTDEMAAALKEEFKTASIAIMAAAVADYHPVSVAPEKLKKDGRDLVLRLKPNQDILAGLGKIKNDQYLVGFAAETEKLLENAAKKMKAKNVDLLVANDVSRKDIGFGSPANEVTLLRPQKPELQLERSSKDKIAAEIFKVIIQDEKFSKLCRHYRRCADNADE